MYSCTHRQPQPPPPHLGSNTRALLVRQDRRHLFVTPWRLHWKFRVGLLITYQVTIFGYTHRSFAPYCINRSHPHPRTTTVMRVMPACPAKSLRYVPLPSSALDTALGRIYAPTAHQSDQTLPPAPPFQPIWAEITTWTTQHCHSPLSLVTWEWEGNI